LRVPYTFVKEKYTVFQEAFGESDAIKNEETKEFSTAVPNIVKKVSEACDRCLNSFTLKNFQANTTSYDAQHGSEFRNPAFDK
jgi:hypothetical protein